LLMRVTNLLQDRIADGRSGEERLKKRLFRDSASSFGAGVAVGTGSGEFSPGCVGVGLGAT
jgi:hypothetical protein